VLFVASSDQKIVKELLIRWWGACVVLDMGTDSQLELVFGVRLLGGGSCSSGPFGGLQVRSTAISPFTAGIPSRRAFLPPSVKPKVGVSREN